MALQLIDLNADVQYIDVDVNRVPYSFTVKLLDKTYTFTIKYNSEGKFFTSDLLDVNGNVLPLGRLSATADRCSMLWRTNGSPFL